MPSPESTSDLSVCLENLPEANRFDATYSASPPRQPADADGARFTLNEQKDDGPERAVNSDLATSSLISEASCATSNLTQLMDIGDSILHDISGVSGLHDSQASQPDPSCSHHTRNRNCLGTSDLSLNLERGPRGRGILSSSRTSQVTLLEDIGDSILNYTGGTNPEEEAQKPSFREHGREVLCAREVTRDGNGNIMGEDFDVPEANNAIDVELSELHGEVELMAVTVEQTSQSRTNTPLKENYNITGDVLNEDNQEDKTFDEFDRLVKEYKFDLLQLSKRRDSPVFRTNQSPYGSPSCIGLQTTSLRNIGSPAIQTPGASFLPRYNEEATPVTPETPVNSGLSVELFPRTCEPTPLNVNNLRQVSYVDDLGNVSSEKFNHTSKTHTGAVDSKSSDQSEQSNEESDEGIEYVSASSKYSIASNELLHTSSDCGLLTSCPGNGPSESDSNIYGSRKDTNEADEKTSDGGELSSEYNSCTSEENEGDIDRFPTVKANLKTDDEPNIVKNEEEQQITSEDKRQLPVVCQGNEQGEKYEEALLLVGHFEHIQKTPVGKLTFEDTFAISRNFIDSSSACESPVGVNQTVVVTPCLTSCSASITEGEQTESGTDSSEKGHFDGGEKINSTQEREDTKPCEVAHKENKASDETTSPHIQGEEIDFFADDPLLSTVKLDVMNSDETPKKSLERSQNNKELLHTIAINEDCVTNALLSKVTGDGTPVSQITWDVAKTMQSTPDVDETVFLCVNQSSEQANVEGALDFDSYDACKSPEENVQHSDAGDDVFTKEDRDPEELMSSLGEEDVFTGTGSGGTFSSLSDSASASPLPPSSPVPPPAEEDLVDALFRTCDTSGRGRVPAARIADHLTVILSDLQPRWLVESLKDTLCIDGEDNQLDITTYRDLLTTWLHDHAKDVNILNSNNPDLDADATCSEVTDILSSPKPDLLAHESHTPVVTPARPLIRPADLTPVQATPCHLSATHLFAPTPVNRTQDSFAWCGNLRDLGDGGEMGRTPPRRQLLYEDRLRQCLEGQLSGGNRRSTLLPWLRPPGSSGPVPGDTLVMSRPPSPISPAASFIYNHTNNNNINNVGGVSFRATVEKVGHAPPLADHSGLNYTFGSLEDEAGTHRPDPGELQQEVLELEHTNRRLTGENAELTTHLTHAEDLNTSLREQCRQLEQALTSVQHQLAGARRLEAEIEELRSLLDTERDEKGRLLSRLAHLERDNQELAARLEHLVDQVNVAHEEAEGWASREAQLVAEHKTQVASLMNQLSHWKSQARTQGDLVHDLEDTVKELRKLTEVLKEEKVSLEHQLSHLREELASVNSQADHEISGVVDEDVKDSRNGDNIVGSIKKVPWGPFFSTPFSGRGVTKSSQETPQSIHSEIQTMGENNGSLPFCEKSEDALLSISQAHGDKNRDSSTTLLSNMLKWWRQWEEHGMTLLLGVQGRDASALHDHFTAHHEELLKIENELQCIIKRKSYVQTPLSSGRPSLSEAVGGSDTSSRSYSSPRSSISRPRTPGSHVSQLISKFENSSPSMSPAPSEISERLGKLVDYNSNVSKELDRSGQTSPSSSVDSPSRTSPIIFKNIRKLNIQRKQRSFEAEMCMEQINVSEDVSEEEPDNISKDAHGERNVVLTENTENCDYPHNSKTQGNKLADVSTEQTAGMLLKMGLDDSEEEKYQTNNNERDNLIEQFEGTESLTVEVELESDIYMENSHLMRLMRQVKEQKICIDELKTQLCIAEEEKESLSAYLSRLHRLVLGVTSDTFRWTEGVRKEWLSRVPGVSEEGAADPLRSPDPLDDGALTGTHSREEIESLIRARCDLGCQHSKDELSKDYVNPENLAAELERELLALKLHVARSHALLHHYQSSSLYGSRSEVSTPPAPPSRQTQGVEAGVECDLCGPTCVPRPSGSTATQTPASPTPASISPSTPAPPECEESEPTSTLWEADEDAADADHVPLTPQHRPLYQKIVVPEEEEEEEAAAVAGVSEDDMAVSSDHALYIPKPRSSKRSGEEKLRRSGLATISPQKGGSSDSDDDTEAHPLRSPQTRLRQISPRSHSDPEVTPLSPPPSLYTEEEEEEEDEPCPKKKLQTEEEPALPSTPESGSSGASPEAFRDEKANTENKNDVSEGKTSPEDDANAACTRQEDEADAPQEEDQSGSSVFPSLPDHYLRSLGLARDDQTPTENLSAQEIEGKFTQVSLALKTDRLTLRQRLDVQQRQRDTAETNFDTEINLLRSAVLALHADCLDTELVDTVAKVRRQLDVLTTTSTRLVTASEDADALGYASDDETLKVKVWGAVQQEWRVSRALEVLLLHVENVKRLYERDHQELEEMRKLLAEYQIELPNSSGNAANASSQNSGDNPASSFRMRALSLAVSNKQQPQETRRISLATGTTRLTAFLGARSSKRRASLMPDLRPFQESKASFAAAAAAVAAAASSRASISAASKDKTEENGQTANEVYSITEEGSESGGEGTETPPLGSSAGTSTQLAISRTLAQLHPDLYSNDPSLTENRLSEDEPRTAAADSTVPATPSPSPELRPQHWLMVCLEDVMGWVRGGRWPYSSQQTVLGARYAFTSLLLLIAAFFLLLTISSSDPQVPQPYHPGWTSVTHVLHPFVTLRYVGNPPT